MKILMFLSLLLLAVPYQTPVQNSAPVNVISYKWVRAKRTYTGPDTGAVPPASAMIPANKNFARNVRLNDPQGVRDPNADTIDGRSAEIEKNVQESRAPRSKQVDGFTYTIKVRNTSANAIEVLFWEYEFVDPLNANNITRHQFFCGVSIRSGKDKELEGFSTTNPSNIIDIDALASKKSNPFQEAVVINRIEYADGAIWQRSDWSLKDVKATYERALKEAWVPGMCKSL